MIDPRTLRGRLGLGYALALLAALSGFAIAALVLVDRTQRGALDEQLTTAARTLVTIPDVRDGRMELDRGDLVQFRRVVERGLGGAILDARGTVLTASSPTLPAAFVARGTRGQELRTVSTADGSFRIADAPIVNRGRTMGAALAWRDLDRIADLDRRLALAFGVGIPVVAAVAVALGSAVAERGLRPLRALAALAAEIEASDLSARLVVPPGNDELSRLCATFDKMLDRLQDAFERQRRFAGDASHELRAPLAVIRAEADLMLRKTRDPAEYERALQAIAAHADELETLVRDLLAAARGEIRVANSEADVRAVVEGALERLEPLARAREIAFAADVDDARARVDANALRRAVTCIVHNALTFSPRGSRVYVAIERAQGEIRIVVTDEGPGFSQGALQHATERFWRDEHVRGAREVDEETGSGLGLSIADAIARSAGGSLRLANRPTGGGIVTVALPAQIRQ